MINIKPFKGLRPKKDLYPSIASAPYDVLTIDEIKEICAKDSLSFLRVIRSEVDFNENVDPYSDKVYEKAKLNLDHMIERGYMVQDDSPCLYVYRQIKGDFHQTGFISAVSVADYEKGLIKKHEKTRTTKENDRIRHIEKLNAHTGFVFLTYRTLPSLNDILMNIQSTTPEVNFETEDKITHALWVVKDKNTINEIVENFKKVEYLYIADGHHRTAAANAISKKINAQKNNSSQEHEYDHFLSIIYPDDHLQILPYNRAIKDLKCMTPEDFILKVEKNFFVEKAEPNDANNGYKPKAPKQIGMYLNGQWYLLRAKDHIINDEDPVSSLDVSLLQKHVLNELLDIKDPKTDPRISFIGGVRGTGLLKELVDLEEFKVTFSMYPTSMGQIMSVADADELMPPKSTWFEPKPRSGMVVHLLG